MYSEINSDYKGFELVNINIRGNFIDGNLGDGCDDGSEKYEYVVRIKYLFK